MAYFHCLIGGGSSGGGYELTVTCDADFAGTTITCTDGVTTLTQTCPSASPYEVVFAIPNGGEWTISGIISGQTYSASIDIPDSLELHSVPEGSTVLPTDDIQTWLACAVITDKAYATLNEVLSDSTTLLALMSNNNAVDYLVRSTTWASGITADSTAMTDIGANNYCANTLLSDSTWAEAICNSTYFESVLNVKVPVMTSNTTPSGECIYGQQVSGGDAYRAFDNNGGTWWAGTPRPTYIGYDFGTPVNVHKISIMPSSTSISMGIDNAIKSFKLQGSNTGNSDDWHDKSDVITVTDISRGVMTHYSVSDDTAYRYNRILEVTNNGGSYDVVTTLQFYGREDV